MWVASAGSIPSKAALMRSMRISSASSGRIDAIAHFNDPVELTNAVGDFCCRGDKDIGLIAIKLDLDWLRNPDKIADYVFHQLRHFDAQPRH
jgi:hypothetical protein